MGYTFNPFTGNLDAVGSGGGGGGAATTDRGWCQARLTTESGVPVSTSNRTSQGTLYYTPIDSAFVRVYNGATWSVQVFSQVSLSLTITSGKLYDVFYNGSALSLSNAWTNDTTRADALATQDGVPCLSSDHTKLHVGTILASGANVIDDAIAFRGIGNVYNLVPRQIQKSSNVTHNYGSNTGRYWNNDSTNIMQFVLPYAQTIDYTLYGDCTIGVTTANGVAAPVVYALPDWTSGTGTVNDATYGIIENWSAPSVITSVRSLDGIATSYPFTAGRHYIAAIEVEFAAPQVSTFEQYRLNGTVWI